MNFLRVSVAASVLCVTHDTDGIAELIEQVSGELRPSGDGGRKRGGEGDATLRKPNQTNERLNMAKTDQRVDCLARSLGAIDGIHDLEQFHLER